MRTRPFGLPGALLIGVVVSLPFVPGQRDERADAGFAPGSRVLLDAHNAYPYEGRWADRIHRALATGVPLAIEQDLVWWCPPTVPCRSIVSHGEPFTGSEPSLRDHFFERIRPLVERALAGPVRDGWPLVTLNLDFKTDEPEHHAAVWALLGEYEDWLVTAERRAQPDDVAPLHLAPVLVLTGTNDVQEVSFHDRVPVGGRLRLFGAVHAAPPPAAGEAPAGQAPTPALPVPSSRTNYRRWWNNPWSVVEDEAPPAAGEWTPAEDARLRALVRTAHAADLWVRFYTLNGHAPHEALGWSASYNFGSRAAVERRWRAAIEAGVDFIATDQYEQLADVLRGTPVR